VVLVFRFGPQNRLLQFGDLGIKITATVSWFGPQNQAGFGFSVAPQNQREEDGAGHMSRSAGLLRLEASCARFSQSGIKTGGDVKQMVHVASSRRSCGVEAEDSPSDSVGCGAVQVRWKYPSLSVVSSLGPTGIFVFWLGL
jgi:hypothetical protein